MPRLKKSETIAACGLDCGSCSIRRYPSDKAAAAEVIGWFKQEGWLKENEGVAEAIERKLVCCGCHGDRNAHWSGDCWILHCCVDAKGLKNCSECTTCAPRTRSSSQPAWQRSARAMSRCRSSPSTTAWRSQRAARDSPCSAWTEPQRGPARPPPWRPRRNPRHPRPTAHAPRLTPHGEPGLRPPRMDRPSRA